MKSISKLLLAAVAAAGITLPAAAQLTLSLSPTSQSTTLGGMTTYNVNISGLQSRPEGNEPALGSFLLTLDYNPAIATAEAVSFGNYLSPSGPGNDTQMFDITSTPGVIQLLDESDGTVTPANQPSSFTLATISIEGIGFGSTPVSFDLSNSSLSDEASNPLDVSKVVNASLTVVPEPGTCALAIFGLGVLGFQARRRAARLS
jgi:hypothetical protein